MAVSWKGCKFISIDPGINHTGWAVYDVPLVGDFRLIDFNSFDTTQEDRFLRIGEILDRAEGVLNQHRPSMAFLENPPDTVYEQKMPMKQIIARAQSVFKTVGVCYSIYTALRSRKITTFTILPVNWQVRSKAQRGGQDIKEWSLNLANCIIKQDLKHSQAILHTGREENIADAICLGYLAYRKNLHQVA